VGARARIAAFAALLVGVFAGAALLGGAINPPGSVAEEDRDDEAAEHSGQESADDHGSVERASTDASGGEATAVALPGLQVAQDGYRLVVDRARRGSGDPRARFEFQIVDRSGRPVREFDVAHEKRMHFIVVRRDMTSFQHLHPTMRPDGTWTTQVNLPRGGVYRVFADFTRSGEQRTLGADVHAGGPYRPEPLPRPQTTAQTEDGLVVSLDAEGAEAGESGRAEFEVRRDGERVNDRLQTYLGAKGHLVALREGDLAYLHTHPEGDELAFMAEYPSAGSYRLFVQFRFEGRVQTAAFTQRVPR
jgi:hypothetical protein